MSANTSPQRGWGIRQVAIYVLVLSACLASIALWPHTEAAIRAAWHWLTVP